MTAASLRALVAARVAAAGVHLRPAVLDGCVAYLELLARWNRRINLTSLPLTDPVPDATIDKLIVEPLCAEELFPPGSPTWLDLGSGGGSPALPLRLACSSGSLTMVEARERKCAFLREAVRQLDLHRTDVRCARFEALDYTASISLITLRAVRIDDELTSQLCRWLAPNATLLCFGTRIESNGFDLEAHRLLPNTSHLYRFRFRA